MRLRRGLLLAILVAPGMGAATIDVSNLTSVVVHQGDTLVFHLATWNFSLDAAAFGLPLYPAGVDFALVSAPPDGAGAFAATLESSDRGVSVAFGDLTFGPGYFDSSGYTRQVSVLRGHLSLTPLLSEAVFGDASAVIALVNLGPAVTLGLDPYLLRQDLYAGLSGEGLSVGALTGSVELQSAVNQVRFANLAEPVNLGAEVPVPEPRSVGLLLGGGVLLCGLAAILGRFPG